MSKVIVKKCNTYDELYLRKVLANILDSYDSIKELKPGSKILLKPNLIIRKRPEAGATTNPKFLKILAELLVKKGFIVVIGDSPGGVFSKIFLKSVYRVCGLNDEFTTVPAVFNYDVDIKEITNKQGKILKKLVISKFIDEVDFIINVPKLKSHVMMVYTGAVKNMFGIVPGEKKAEYHFNSPNYDDFADSLIDVYLSRKPHLNIMDAIVGMDGEGPTSGRPINIGLVLASDDGFALDYTALKILKIDPLLVPIIKMGINRGLVSNNIKDIEIEGEKIEDVIYSNFEFPNEDDLKSVVFINNSTFKNLAYLLRKKPYFDYNLCIKCKECVKVCPAKAINFDNSRPEVDYKKCINCFCCHELCPADAISIKESKILKIVVKTGVTLKSLCDVIKEKAAKNQTNGGDKSKKANKNKKK